MIGLDKSSVLDYQPASIFATVYVTERLVNPADEDARQNLERALTEQKKQEDKTRYSCSFYPSAG